MTIVADVRLKSSEFDLGRLVSESDIEVRMTEFVPVHNSVVPYLWVEGDVDGFTAALATDERITHFEQLDELGERTLFRVKWTNELDGLFAAIKESDVIVSSGHSLGDYWEIRLLMSERESLAEFYEISRRKGITVSLQRLTDSDRTGEGYFGLTEKQREALVAAYRGGYFDPNGKMSLQELSDEFGISHQAASKRLERGINTLMESTLMREIPDVVSTEDSE